MKESTSTVGAHGGPHWGPGWGKGSPLLLWNGRSGRLRERKQLSLRKACDFWRLHSHPGERNSRPHRLPPLLQLREQIRFAGFSGRGPSSRTKGQEHCSPSPDGWARLAAKGSNLDNYTTENTDPSGLPCPA